MTNDRAPGYIPVNTARRISIISFEGRDMLTKKMRSRTRPALARYGDARTRGGAIIFHLSHAC